MPPLIVFNLWPWIEAYRSDVEPSVGNKVILEDSHFTSTIACCPHA